MQFDYAIMGMGILFLRNCLVLCWIWTNGYNKTIDTKIIWQLNWAVSSFNLHIELHFCREMKSWQSKTIFFYKVLPDMVLETMICVVWGCSIFVAGNWQTTDLNHFTLLGHLDLVGRPTEGSNQHTHKIKKNKGAVLSTIFGRQKNNVKIWSQAVLQFLLLCPHPQSPYLEDIDLEDIYLSWISLGLSIGRNLKLGLVWAYVAFVFAWLLFLLDFCFHLTFVFAWLLFLIILNRP